MRLARVISMAMAPTNVPEHMANGARQEASITDATSPMAMRAQYAQINAHALNAPNPAQTSTSVQMPSSSAGFDSPNAARRRIPVAVHAPQAHR